jgi:hypothetical protein
MEETVGGEEDLAERAEGLDAGFLRRRRRGGEGRLRRGFLGGRFHFHRLDLQRRVRDRLGRLQLGEVFELGSEQAIEVGELLGRRLAGLREPPGGADLRVGVVGGAL